MSNMKPLLEQQIKEAKAALENHGVVAFPTETVMGLGVLYNDFAAYQRLNNVKERPEDKPYTMMLGDPKDIKKYAVVDERTQRVIDKYMPGSLTILLKVKKYQVPNYVTHDTGVIGIRIPSNPEALVLLKEVGQPLLVPSANKSGKAPAMTSDEVKEIFGNELDYIIYGKANSGLPSTIVDLTGEEIKVVRQGSVVIEKL